jgi:hypothetical protein
LTTTAYLTPGLPASRDRSAHRPTEQSFAATEV